MRAARRGLGGVYLPGGVWWIRYSYRGDKRRESSGSVTRTRAMALLKKRLGEMGQGRLVGPEPEKVTINDLGKMLLDDYSLKGNTSSSRAQRSLVHIQEYFGENARALDVTLDALVGYAKRRQEGGAAATTIRNEFAALKRGFNLAVRAGRMPQRPPFPVIAVNNRRTGFFEEAEFRAIQSGLPEDVSAVAEFLYWTGWRSGEVVGLEWRNVDVFAGIIRIETSKNDEPRTLPFNVLPALARLIERQRERTSAIEQAKGVIIPYVFHRGGRPIRSFRGVWEGACKAAGLPHRIPHDFRRTAARNLSRAGVPERVIMQLCGWKTRSVFDRYRIVNETDLAEGLAKLAKATAGPEPEARKVVPMRTGTERAQRA